MLVFFFFSSRRRHTRWPRDWSSDVCSSDLRRTRLTSSVGWWSPDPRGVLPLAGLRVSRSLRQSVRRFELRLDTAFDTVITACADPARDGGWIRRDVKAAYLRLHELGWAHSVEAWSVEADGT